MHVGIANPRWWRKRSRHSRRIRNLQFYVSCKRPMHSESTNTVIPGDLFNAKIKSQYASDNLNSWDQLFDIYESGGPGTSKPRPLCMMTSSNGKILRVTGHLCGEFTGHQWIPHTKACDAELLRKSKDYVYGIWVYKVLGIWKFYHRVTKSLVSCIKPWTGARNNNKSMKSHSKLTYQLSF